MDPYKVLGVDEKASSELIKQAFRDLSKRWHPDKPNGDQEKFAKIAAAYEILSDPEKKKMFDEYGVTRTEDQLNRKADALLQQTFQALISQYGMERILAVDVMSELKSLLDQGIQEVKSKKAESEKVIKSLGDILGKFTFKREKNPIKTMLDVEIGKHNSLVLDYNAECEIAKRTYELLKDYEFDAEASEFKAIKFGPGSFTANTQSAFWKNV